jgi:1,4-alpha-glucan branching enzyme
MKVEPVKLESARPEPAKAAPAKVESVNVESTKAAPTVKVEPVKPVMPQPKASTSPRVFLELVKPDAKNVCVAGSFNGWKPEKTPLSPAGNGRWVGDLAIGPGKYEYLFVVDGQWMPDPKASETVQNPFGGRNSVLVVMA